MVFCGKNICELCFNELDESGFCKWCGGVQQRHPVALPLGTVLQERYIIGRVLGKGGFGITYLAYDKSRNMRVAIKEYMPDGIAYRDNSNRTTVSTFDENKTETFISGAEKFFEEAKTISRFNGNPNIISVYEFFRENGTVYYTMEYLDGIDLKQHLKEKHGFLSEQETLIIANAVADALLIVHSTGILHRDISPDNIFICADGRIKLLDFGAARQVVGEQSKSLSVILKQGFAPLEQYQSKGRQGPWTDIYAFGATLYYAATGKVVEEVMSRLSNPELAFPADAKLSDGFKAVLAKCLQLQPENRYQSIFELKRDLAEINNQGSPLEATVSLNDTAPLKTEQSSTVGEKLNNSSNKLTGLVDFIKKRFKLINSEKRTVSYNASSTEINSIKKKKLKKSLIVVLSLVVTLIIISALLSGRDSSEAAKKSSFKLEVGNAITLGTYEQDDNTANGVEPIEWRVLAVEDNKALVISEYCLDAKPYNEEDEDVTWETCTLRDWLNDDFYNSAFTAGEKAKIQSTRLKNPDNPKYGTQGGNDTTDKVFLLSYDEAEKYFESNEDRMAKPTDYAIAKDILIDDYFGGSCYWRLRSPGDGSNFTGYVNYDGYVSSSGLNVDFSHGGVRPAMWVDVDELEDAIDSLENTSYESDISNLSVGDSFTFGTYEQDNNTSNGKEKIEWCVLAVEGGKALVISEYCLDAKPYNEENEDVTWETCTLRDWLNDDFYNSAFTAGEKAKIQSTRLKNPDNPEYGTEGGNDTTDKVFLLSYDEAEKYFESDEDRMAKPTDYAIAKDIWISDYYGGTCYWRLRSPGDYSYYASYVGSGGYVGHDDIIVDSSPDGIRPALWINL